MGGVVCGWEGGGCISNVLIEAPVVFQLQLPPQWSFLPSKDMILTTPHSCEWAHLLAVRTVVCKYYLSILITNVAGA